MPLAFLLALAARRARAWAGRPVVLATLLLLGAVPAIRAQTTFIWDGGHPAQDNWSVNQNWNPNGAPSNNGTANLVFTGTIRLTPDANGAWSINSLTFDSAAGSFLISGGPITLQGSAVTYALANNSSLTQQISSALTLGGAQTWTANTGALTLSGAVNLGAHALTFTGASNTSVSGVISGTGGIAKTGTGTLTLTAANTYSGGTTVSGGTLVGDATSLQGAISNDAALVFNQASTGSFGGTISGAGTFTKQNTGTLTLSGTNSFTGATSVTGGTLALGIAGALSNSTAVDVASGATLQLAASAQTIGSLAGAGGVNLGAFKLTTGGNNATTTFSGVISGSGDLEKTGSGTFTLSGANTYSGNTTITGGTLTGTTTSLHGNIANNAALVFDQAANGTFSGSVSGSGSLTKQNSGTLTLAGANSYSGATLISGGTLALGAANALASGSDVTLSSGGTLQLAGASQTAGSIAGAGGIDLGAFTLTTGGSNASTTFSGVISGTGALTKTGTGTLTLTGANAYTGGTTISAGTLQGTTTSLVGNITDNAALVFDQAATGTFAGAIAGTGSVTKQNSGTLILSGANSYSGGTIVSAGTLQGDTTSLQGNVTNNAALVFDQATTGTFAGAISGSGSVTKQNSGTLVLTGANSYSGGTTISTGTLQGDTSSLQGSIANNAALVFDQAATGTFAGAISGSGSVTKQNSGTLVLSGANSYSGGTTISAGTLQGSTTSLQGNITNDAALVFDQSSTGTFAGAISGTGALTKQNSGTLVLTGANSYSGGTTVSGGTLQGDTTSLQGNIVNNAGVVFDQAGSGAFAGVISGTGSVTKQNTGTLTLSGANTYSGATTVSAGTLALAVDNTLSAASNLTLSAGTTLDLAGHSAQVGTFAYNTAVIDYGAIPATNYFLFTGGGTSTGTLTINNFSSTSGDVLAFQTGAAGITGSFVNGVYFYGIGGGVLGATGQTLTGYSGTWDFITPNSATFETWVGGAGNNNWSSNANWGDGSSPVSGTALRLEFDGTTRLTPTMNGSYTLNTLRFNAGAGAFTLGASGTNALTFGGAVPGIIQLSANAQTVNTPIVLNTSTVVETTGAGTLTLAGAISGSGAINKVGASTLVLSGANTYSGATTINAGNVVLQNSAGLGSTAAGTTVTAGATLQLAGNISVGAESLALDGTLRNTTGANTYAGAISGSGSVVVDAGSLALTGTTANTYTGNTTINSGALLDLGKSASVAAVAGNLYIGGASGSATARLLANEQIANNAAIVLGAGGTPVFNLNGFTETVGSIASSNTAAAVQLGAGALLTGGDNSSTTFAGVISDTGALTKQGTGTFTLSGANTYSGNTTVSAGTLVLQNSSALGTTAAGTSVASGATLQLENNLSVGAEALTLNGTLRSASGTNSFGGAISGSGNLVLDAGSLTLGGTSANTFSGTTTVNSGTLDLNKTAGLNAVSGALAIGNGTGSATVRLLASNQISDTSAVTLGSGGTPVLNVNGFAETIGSLSSANASAAVQLGTGGSLATGADNSSTAFAGVISGAGALTKQGSGTFTLTGANTYSGGTTISGGTLQGSTTSLQGNITNNAALTFDQAASGTFAGAISGSGSVTKQNAGTLILTGANSYAGGTTIAGGTLQGSTSSLQGNVTNNAALVFDQAAGGTFAGAISGSGSVTKQNAGALILTGANSYAGGTTIAGGTLQGSTSSLQGNITNNAALVFDQSSAGTFSGAISGSGSVTKQNTGTLILSGANSYAGGTTVSGGTLQGSTTSLQGNITNNAALVFDQAASGTFSSVISGSGSVTKQNSGTLTLTSANTYSGGTTVSGGTLALGASNVLAATGNLTLGYGSTFDLGGAFSNRIGTLSFDTAAIQFGTAGNANFLLFGSAGTNTGTLTISNWTSGSDVFGVATNTVGQSFLDNILFAGIGVGIGAVISSTPTSVGSYGSFYTITPIPTFVWSGSQSNGPSGDQDNWSKSGNWSGGIAPGIGAVKALVMTGSVKTSNDMDGAYQVKSLLFDTNAGSFNISSSTGDTLTIGGGGILNQSANTQTLNVPIALSANQTWTAASGNLVFSGASVLNSTYNLTINGDHDTTISSVIGSGSGGVVKNGAGTLKLSGNNTYTGGTQVNGGTLVLAHANAAGSTAQNVTLAGATLNLATDTSVGSYPVVVTADSTVVSNKATASSAGITHTLGNLTLNNGSTLHVSAGGNVASGTAGISFNAAQLGATGATLDVGSGASLAIGAVNGANTGFSVSGAGDTTISGAVATGTGGVTMNGSGTLTLAGDSTFTGAVTINSGTVKLGGAGNATNSPLGTTSGGTTVNSGGTLDLNGFTLGTTEALTLRGTGTGSAGALITSTGSATFSGAVTLGAATTIGGAGNLTLGGTFNPAGFALTKAGAGTLTLPGGAVTIDTLHVNGGTLAVASGTTLTTNALDATAGATLSIATGGTVVANYASGSTTFSGALAGSGTFQKDGAGTLVFDQSFSASGLTLTLSGGTLSLLGAQVAVGTIHITGDTILDFGSMPGTSLSSANLVVDAGVNITVQGWMWTSNDALQSTPWFVTSTINGGTLGVIDQNGSPLNQITFTNYNGFTTTWVSGTHDGWFNHEIRPAPEPATTGALIMGAALACLVWRRRRRNWPPPRSLPRGRTPPS